MERQQIIRTYQTRHERAKQQLLLKKQQLQEQYPHLAEKEKELQQKRNSAAKAAIAGQDLASIQKDLRALEENLQQTYLQTLQQAGLPQDYLKGGYQCARCNDSGFIVENGMKIKCKCLQDALVEQAIGGLENQPSFHDFNANLLPEGKQREAALNLKGILQDYAQNFPKNEKKNLLLLGNTGLGKTFHFGCVSSAIAQKGHSVRLLTAYKLLELFRAQHFSQGYHMPYLTSVEFLAIDDLGSEPMYRNITVEYLFTLLNERMKNNKATAFASNLMPAQLQELYGERISSRLMDQSSGRVFLLEGEDIRLTPKK